MRRGPISSLAVPFAFANGQIRFKPIASFLPGVSLPLRQARANWSRSKLRCPQNGSSGANALELGHHVLRRAGGESGESFGVDHLADEVDRAVGHEYVDPATVKAVGFVVVGAVDDAGSHLLPSAD